MAESSRIQSLANDSGNGTARTAESYLEFSRQCVEEVRIMTSPSESESSKVINYEEQCVYLIDKLKKAVKAASLFLERIQHNGGNSVSTEDSTESTLELFMILCMLAKKVNCFIQGCCNGHWLHRAIMCTNLADCTASLGFDLELFSVLPPFSASKSTLSSSEVSALRRGVDLSASILAFIDENRLVKKLRALLQFGQASNDDLELATFLLERLDSSVEQRMNTWTLEPPQPILHERDLTRLKDRVLIGRGGYATVHKASWLGIDVAVKTFYGTDNPVFNQEVSILAGLSHPNVVSFLCHGKDVGESCIVMELMDRDLFSFLKERLRSNRTQSSPFSVFEEFDIMLQIAEAMDYLHRMHVLHRDLKSHNILVRCMRSPDAEGYEYVQVKVSDFGLSRTKEFSMTRSNMTPNTGTARWMAPELIKFRNSQGDFEETEVAEPVENYPFKCEVYSFGMVCLEILTGDVPFRNVLNPNEVKRAVRAGERPQIPERCHERLKTLIGKCWNREPSSRPCFGDICKELSYLKSLHMMQMSQGTWIRMFTISDLRSMTGNFAESKFLGCGDCSVVHKGTLADGRKVAVKRVTGAMTWPCFEFIELELKGWMSARHPHLMETLGYCIDGNDFLLVTEYMSLGTLAQHLAKYQESNPDRALWWKRRLLIAMDVARALVYLHEFDFIFLHFNLKSSNVLVDDDLNAKVSGFGLMNCSADAGPSGHMAPENIWGMAQIKAAHVYSFGVVLMELLIGFPAVVKNQDSGQMTKEKRKQNFISWFRNLHAGDSLAMYRQSFGGLSRESFSKLTELAMNCTTNNPDSRPDMNHAVSVLQQLLREEGLVSLANLGDLDCL